MSIDFFVYSRDAPGTAALRGDEALLEQHWSYMDRFAESMIARGPTLRADRETATGSLHILGLPSVEAAREFVAREPNNRRGIYAEHTIWRFENLLGRTMWEFAGATDEPKLLVVARSPCRPVPPCAEVRDRLILYGALSTLDEAEPVGVALAVQARDREAADPLLAAFPDVEEHCWEFGGRR